MQPAYLHMLTNHAPILGAFFGLLLLGCGFLSRSQHLKHAAYLVFLAAAIGGIAANASGEAAEHLIKALPDVSRDRIHAHEDSATWSLIALCVLGALSLAGLWAGRMKPSLNDTISFWIGLIGLIAFGLSARTGYLGGEIRHTEFHRSAIHETPESGVN